MITSSDIDKRTKALLGEEALTYLKKSKIALFGVGGVGGTALEALSRTGVGEIHIFDYDVVEESNLNRQILFTANDIGKKKVDVAKARIAAIRDDVQVIPHFLRLTGDSFSFASEHFDLLIDAIDDLEAKLGLMEFAIRENIPLFLSLGMARRMNPSLVSYATLDKTGGDALGKKLRKRARELGFDLSQFTAVYSKEPLCETHLELGSAMMVPSAAGLLLAFLAVSYLTSSRV